MNIILHYIKPLFNNKSEEIKNVKYLFILQIVDKIIPLIVVPYLMIALGAKGYGIIGFSTAIIQYLILVTDFGFNLSSAQRIAINNDDKKIVSSIFFSTMYAKILLLITGTILVLIIIFLAQPVRGYAKTILCMYPWIIGNILSAPWLFQGVGKIRMSALVTSGCKLLILPVTFIFVKQATDYNKAAFIQAIVPFVAGCINIILIIKLKLVSFVRVSIKTICEEIKQSFPLFLSSVATSAYTQLFTVILGFNSDSAAVGRYTAAEKIMRSLCFAVYSPISAGFYPRIAALSSQNIFEAKMLIKKLVKVVAILMIILSVIIFTFADFISKVLGNGYEEISCLLRIISPAMIAIALGAIFGHMGLIAIGNIDTRKQFMKTYLIAGVFSIILVLIMSFYFAEIGAAISLLLTEYLVFAMMYYFYSTNNRCL